MLGIKRRSVYQYRRTGRIEGVYFGRALMISKSSAEKWLTDQQATKASREKRKSRR